MAEETEQLDMHVAARQGDVATLTRALAFGGAVNGQDLHRRTPLHLAAWAGHAPAVQLLLTSGAGVAVCATDGVTALHFACQRGHTDVVRLLLAGGAKVRSLSSKGFTPLHYAAQSGCAPLVELLLRKRADPRARDKRGLTPADVAKAEDVKALIIRAADQAEAGPAGEAEEPEALVGPPLRPKPEYRPAAAKRASKAAALPEAADDAKRKRVILSFDDGEA